MDLIDVREDIRAALADGRPVVALESSVIAHVLPSPVNVRVAHSLEDAVRVAGAILATVGVIAGRLQVGLEPEEIERLGGAGDILRCAAGNLGWAIVRRADSATTVFAAASVGIDVVATGGIGGVHRGDTGDAASRRHRPVLPHPLASAQIEQATTQALRDAAAQDVNGKRLTPWLLAAVTEILGSRTLAANQALLLNKRAGRCEHCHHPVRAQLGLDVPVRSLIDRSGLADPSGGERTLPTSPPPSR